MPETPKLPEQSNPNSSQAPFNWHLHKDELVAMTDVERDLYLDEKLTRLHSAFTAFVKGDGKTTSEEIDMILNRERYPSTEDLGAH